MEQAKRAAAAVFFVNGVLFANWVTRVPDVKDAVDTTTGPLGAALLGMGVGSLISMPFAGRLCERHSSRTVTTAGGLLLSTSLLAPAVAPDVVVLGLTLLFYGASFGLLDVAMNVQAVQVVKRLQRPVMPWLHAAFSFGGLAGAAIGGLAAGVDVPLLLHFAVMGAVVALVVLWARPRMLPDATEPEPSPDAPPGAPQRRAGGWLSLAVVGIGAVATCAALGEGVMADWSTLFMRDVRDVSSGPAAAGFAGFSVAMTAGRLGGEAAIRRVGAVRVVRYGGTMAAAGVLLAVVVPSPVTTVAGFLLIGLGLSCGFPLAMSTAGERGAGSGSNEITVVSIIGYLGFLLGPPMIGLLAEIFGLGAALLSIGVSSLALAALAPVLAPPASSTAAGERATLRELQAFD